MPETIKISTGNEDEEVFFLQEKDEFDKTLYEINGLIPDEIYFDFFARLDYNKLLEVENIQVKNNDKKLKINSFLLFFYIEEKLHVIIKKQFFTHVHAKSIEDRLKLQPAIVNTIDIGAGPKFRGVDLETGEPGPAEWTEVEKRGKADKRFLSNKR